MLTRPKTHLYYYSDYWLINQPFWSDGGTNKHTNGHADKQTPELKSTRIVVLYETDKKNRKMAQK